MKDLSWLNKFASIWILFDMTQQSSKSLTKAPHDCPILKLLPNHSQWETSDAFYSTAKVSPIFENIFIDNHKLITLTITSLQSNQASFHSFPGHSLYFWLKFIYFSIFLCMYIFIYYECKNNSMRTLKEKAKKVRNELLRQSTSSHE